MELEKKILGYNITSPDEWISNVNECGLFIGKEEEIILERINLCISYLRADWETTLKDRGFTIPKDDFEFSELVFSQPDYKNREERDAKTTEQLLEEAKTLKINGLENDYINSQWLSVKNGHEFIVPLAGDNWKKIENACFSAGRLGVADLIWQDINGEFQLLKDLPVAEWYKFYAFAKPIGVSNKALRVIKEVEIASCKSQDELNTITWNFPAIQQILIDL